MKMKLEIKSYLPFCLISVLFLLCCKSTADKKTLEQDLLDRFRSDSGKKSNHDLGLASLTRDIGEKFPIDNFIDTSGTKVKLNFSTSDITIIDFWYDGCKACVEEMAQFKNIIEGKEKQVRIISTCISSYHVWRDLFTSKDYKYQFLKAPVRNWQHLNLQSTDDPKLNNTISMDRLKQLGDKLDVVIFPSYFVINKEGIIIARPLSAVEYIKNNIK